jgi:hypothetical protein
VRPSEWTVECGLRIATGCCSAPSAAEQERPKEIALPTFHTDVQHAPKLVSLKWGNPYCEDCGDDLKPGWRVAW